MRQRLSNLHYAWVVALITFVTMLISAGIRATPGVLMVPLTSALGWTRETVSTAIAINLLLYGLIAPFSAALMARFGIRRTTTVALACLAVGTGLTALMRSPWQMNLLWGVVVGSATGFTATVLGVTVATRWFHRQRGLVIGLLTASNASGTLIFLPLLAKLVSVFGWQAATLATCLGTLLLIPGVLLLLRDRPADKGLMPYGATVPEEAEPAPAAGERADNPLAVPLRVLSAAVRRRPFWLLIGSFMICGLSTTGLISNHLIPALMDHGYGEVRAAGLVSLMGVFDIIGTTTSGWLTDRFRARWLLGWYYGLRGLALFWLPIAITSGSGALLGFIMFYGLDWVATVPPTVRLAGENFPGRSPVVYGWVFTAHQIGAAIAAFGAGALYTHLHTYDPAFRAAALLCLVAACLAMSIGRTSAGSGRRLRPRPAPALGPAGD